MPRPLRKEFENAWYHIMNRGAGRKAIFKSDKHKATFLSILNETNALFGVEIHAYCLMTNHYHLLIRTPRANLSRIMRHINGVYTQRFNRSQKTDGSLFRGRYKSIIVSFDEYLLNVSRYIHLNPVAANINVKAEDYLWSSYRHYLNPVKKPTWLFINETLSLLNQSNPTNAYRRFITSGLDDKTREFYEKKNSPSIFGSEYFKKQILNSLPPETIRSALPDFKRTQVLPMMSDIMAIVCQHFKTNMLNLNKLHRGQQNDARAIAIFGCRMWAEETLQSIATTFGGCSLNNISNLISRIKLRLKKDKEFSDIVEQIKDKMRQM